MLGRFVILVLVLMGAFVFAVMRPGLAVLAFVALAAVLICGRAGCRRS